MCLSSSHEAADKRFTFAAHLVWIDMTSAFEDTDLRVVDLSIRLMPFDVFIAVLYGGESEDDDKGQDNETGTDCREAGDELEDTNEQEEPAVTYEHEGKA